MDKTKLKKHIANCKKSATYFMENSCKIGHPMLGIVPFRLFDYQKTSLYNFRNNRFNIFKKCRQCGISTLSGVYALWVAMFFSDKKILIVSKRDDDAKEFLYRNVKLVYLNLPDWMKQIWGKPPKELLWNEHEVGFKNGSIIRSLTSSPDTLRSNAASLNIIDEAAFMPDMEAMWSGGYSTLQHGGSCLVISTPNGVGGWYWEKWTDAETNNGLFNPILINWWDMDWVLDAEDPISGKRIRIAPTEGIKKCTTKEEIEKWGPYWSPWLENEYKGLQSKGEAHLFRQEILGEFIGSGSTVVPTGALFNVGNMVKEAPEAKTVAEPVLWINNVNGEREYIDFTGEDATQGLLVWAEPVVGSPAKFSNGRLLSPGKPGHTYVIGVDIATGENNDYSAIEVFDVDTMEQVAEYMGRVQIQHLARMVDWLGRWYNNALVNPERTGVGSGFIQDLKNMAYPNIWRQKKEKSNPSKKAPAAGVTFSRYGFPTTANSKPTLNKALIEHISENEGEGYSIYSDRLYKQLLIYVRHRNRQGVDTKKTGAQTGRGNHDDLVIAAALAFIAIPDSIDLDPMGLLPSRSKQESIINLNQNQNQNQNRSLNQQETEREELNQNKNKLENIRDPNVIIPLTYNEINKTDKTHQEQLDMFTNQLISGRANTNIVSNRNVYKITKPK